MLPVVYFSGCFGLHGTFKVRVNKPLAQEQEEKTPAVPGDNTGQEQEYSSPVLVSKEGDQGSLRVEPLKPCACGTKCKEDFYGA